jgi:hypothetical protein
MFFTDEKPKSKESGIYSSLTYYLDPKTSPIDSGIPTYQLGSFLEYVSTHVKLLQRKQAAWRYRHAA